MLRRALLPHMQALDEEMDLLEPHLTLLFTHIGLLAPHLVSAMQVWRCPTHCSPFVWRMNGSALADSHLVQSGHIRCVLILSVKMEPLSGLFDVYSLPII